MKKTALMAAVAVFAISTAANAATLVGTISDNDCAGVFGTGFSDCLIPANYSGTTGTATPIIAKWDVGTGWQVNSSLYPSIDGSEFEITNNGDGTGSFTYTAGAGDPFIQYFAAKGSDAFNLYWWDNATPITSASWVTPTNESGGPAGLSHLSFYDTIGNGGGGGTGGGGVTPEPATLALFGFGLVAVARRLRLRK